MRNCSTYYETCSDKVEEIGFLDVFTTVCVIEIIFNCLIFYVFSKSEFNSKMTSSTLTYLTGLALADCLSCVSSLPLPFIMCMKAQTSSIQYFCHFYELYIYHPIGNSFITTSVWITLSLTIERFTFVTKRSNIHKTT